MAAPEQQIAYPGTVGLSHGFVPGRAIVSVNSKLASHADERSCDENSSLIKAFRKIINTRNAIIIQFIMLILLLSLQAPVCCDDTVTDEIPHTVEQTLRAEPVQHASVNNQAAVQVTALVKSDIAQSELTGAEPNKISRAQAVTTGLTSKSSLMSPQAMTPDVAVLELEAMASASGPDQPAAVMNENINTIAAATLTAVTDAGFIKIAYTGEALDDKVDRWECVEDTSTRLTWEVKKNNGGIRDKNHSYSWLSNINGKADGISNGGRCKGGVRCDTYSYARAMNEQKLCGYSDWRIPTRSELETLVEYQNSSAVATINNKYFPEAVPSWYWSSSENTNREAYAWYVLFRNGVSLNDLKERPKHIRLVRGRTPQ